MKDKKAFNEMMDEADRILTRLEEKQEREGKYFKPIMKQTVLPALVGGAFGVALALFQNGCEHRAKLRGYHEKYQKMYPSQEDIRLHDRGRGEGIRREELFRWEFYDSPDDVGELAD